MQVNRELERQFVADTKTQFGVPFDEYYNKYIKWLEEKAIQTQAGVGVPSETLSCEQNCLTCCYHGNCPIESATYSMSIKRPFSCSEFAIEP